jgi:hypothetical protein
MKVKRLTEHMALLEEARNVVFRIGKETVCL